MKRGIVLGIALIIGVLGYFIVQWYVFTFFFVRNAHFKTSEAHLLRDTDYHALLDTCRELSQRADELGLKRGHEYSVYLVEGSPEPEVAKFPAIIRDLEPAYVRLADDCVLIVFAGGLTHAGVVAYLADHMTGPFVDFMRADQKKELIPGLWFYDEAYHGNAHDTRRIDALIEEGKKHQLSMQAAKKDAKAPK